MKPVQMLLLLAALAGTLAAAPAPPPDDADVADVPSEDVLVRGNPAQRYFLIGAGDGVEAPTDGFNLLVVLPGGDGGPGFLPFIKRVYKNVLGDRYLVAQLVAYRWTEQQKLVWPIARNPVEEQQFTTEEFVASVVRDVSGKHKVNPERVFVLGWSSGGPPAYATALMEGSPVKGAFVAMSVFKATQVESLKAAKDRPFYICHSPQDKVCPISMARGARFMLNQNGAKVRFAEYPGGHGWHGTVYGDITQGMAWLESAAMEADAAGPVAADAAAPAAGGGDSPVDADVNLLFRDDFERGLQQPNNWVQSRPIPGVEYIWDDKSAHEGRRSLCLRKTAQSYFPIASWTRTASHDRKQKKLHVSVWVRADRAAKAVVDVGFMNRAGQPAGHAWAVYIGARKAGDPPANHDWILYEGTVDVPGTARALNIGLQTYGPGTVWFDDITATYVR